MRRCKWKKQQFTKNLKQIANNRQNNSKQPLDTKCWVLEGWPRTKKTKWRKRPSLKMAPSRDGLVWGERTERQQTTQQLNPCNCKNFPQTTTTGNKDQTKRKPGVPNQGNAPSISLVVAAVCPSPCWQKLLADPGVWESGTELMEWAVPAPLLTPVVPGVLVCYGERKWSQRAPKGSSLAWVPPAPSCGQRLWNLPETAQDCQVQLLVLLLETCMK